MTTTIRVSVELREHLIKLGVKGQTYEDIIWKLITEEEGKSES